MTEPRKPSRTTKSSGSKGPSTTGQQTEPGSRWPMASADDPIFSRGYVIGSKRSTPSSPSTSAPAAKDTRAKERELFDKMRRVKVWPMAPDQEPDEKA